MVEAQKYRIEQEMTKMVNELDKSYLRKMQGDMHRCAAKCCDDTQTSLERVHGCIDNCTTALNNANNYVQKEMVRNSEKDVQQFLVRSIISRTDYSDVSWTAMIQQEIDWDRILVRKQ
ncbi:protein FAM136A isoform X2 [Battus philenor]|uniref:protein FAM136A isoform X2 n=1 Tax=Battus philenor TaxID=42288 RepID=UPI0035D089F7